jgi:hypothetical protein
VIAATVKVWRYPVSKRTTNESRRAHASAFHAPLRSSTATVVKPQHIAGVSLIFLVLCLATALVALDHLPAHSMIALVHESGPIRKEAAPWRCLQSDVASTMLTTWCQHLGGAPDSELWDEHPILRSAPPSDHQLHVCQVLNHLQLPPRISAQLGVDVEERHRVRVTTWSRTWSVVGDVDGNWLHVTGICLIQHIQRKNDVCRRVPHCSL